MYLLSMSFDLVIFKKNQACDFIVCVGIVVSTVRNFISKKVCRTHVERDVGNITAFEYDEFLRIFDIGLSLSSFTYSFIHSFIH